MMDFNDSSNFPAFLHKVSSNYLAPQCSTWQHFGVAQASQKIHMRQTSHCPHSKPAWSQESSITIKSYKIIQFWQTLKIYWLIWLIFVHFLVIQPSQELPVPSRPPRIPEPPGRFGMLTGGHRLVQQLQASLVSWLENKISWKTNSVRILEVFVLRSPKMDSHQRSCWIDIIGLWIFLKLDGNFRLRMFPSQWPFGTFVASNSPLWSEVTIRFRTDQRFCTEAWMPIVDVQSYVVETKKRTWHKSIPQDFAFFMFFFHLQNHLVILTFCFFFVRFRWKSLRL